MKARLIVYVLGVALSVAASLAAIASQSGTFLSVHEIPPFVCARVELVPGVSVARPADDDYAGGNNRITQSDVPGGPACGMETMTAAPYCGCKTASS